jgi:ferric-dicitrate binding protein FerR (iron transport regulator)
MTRRSFAHIDPTALRDHADEARVDRVWERVDHDLAGRDWGQARGARRARRASLAYLAAAAIGAFGGGMLLGKVTWDRGKEPAPQPVVAVPVVEQSLVEVLAAGTQLRTFPLQGGGQVTLSPGATVEAERSGSAVTLSLLQGEASIDSAGRTLVVLAGDARINTQSGSVLSLRRNAEDLDVRVDHGTVSVSSPAGAQQLATNQRETVPIHATVASTPVDAKPPQHRAARPRRHGEAHPSLPKPASLSEWFTHYPHDGAGALALLRKQGVEQAISQARSPAELAAIAELMAGLDPAACARALERLVRDFPRDQRAPLAARDLAVMYKRQGNEARAQEYREKIAALAKNANTGSDALFCDVIRHETDKTKAALMAKEYLD